ncbi:MAG: hydroxyethylthiazole kinase [Oscillospiraceae bacterium]|nr:hydroxyethylthiazole kinase [Oscillospiraceae bacterium]
MLDFTTILGNVRAKAPLVHNITNYVTVNDCANILLACGGSPIMSDDEGDVEDITSICGGLNINIGTLNKNTIPSMFLAGKRANALSHPVLLDPVGAGASKLRSDTAARLVDELRLAVIRGNISEIKALAQGSSGTHGVDADEADRLNAANLDSVIAFARAFARRTNAVVAITGATDLITDGARVCTVTNGHPMMSRITGTGCMLSAMTTAFVTANPACCFEAVCTAVIAMGLCGELAHARLGAQDGNASYRNYIIDAVYHLTARQLEDGARYEMR